jgi:RNA polymerase sigma factor (sigma-70 family)
VFPTTIWTRIQQAGAQDPAALEDFGERYRRPVLEFVEGRGFRGADAEDICHDVFLRVLRGGVLAKADRDRGRFRSLLLSVTTHVIQDRLRRKRDTPVEEIEVAQREADFDRAWAWHLTERAMDALREEGSPYYDVLRRHLGGEKQDRNRLWIARRKLGALIRREVADTCASPEDFEDELAYLSRYLRPPEKA